MKMKVSFRESINFINRIRHIKCINAAEKYWKQNSDSSMKTQSICWLYCWAKSGNGSEKAMLDAQTAFNKIFSKTFDYMDAHIKHEWARKMRYENMEIDYTAELSKKLM